MNYKTADINLNVETQAHGKFVLLQVAVTMTPELALTITKAIAELRNAVEGEEEPERKKFVDEVIGKIEATAKAIGE